MLRPWLGALIALTVVLPVAKPGMAVEQRVRLRDLGINIGRFPTGQWNAITDVSGVKVGQVTLSSGSGALVPGKGPVRTGVTAIIPRDNVWHDKVFAGLFSLNGNGEMTAAHWIKEAGWLETPIVLTDTLSVPRASDGVVSWMEKHYPAMGIGDDVVIPCVAECDDEFLNDQRGRHVSPEDVVTAIEQAKTGPVAEGSVGAGTGMTSFWFKGGIGTASRVLPKEDGGYTVGILMNCNMGTRRDLRIDGVPVGLAIQDFMPKRSPSEGSVIMVAATDAPLLPHQLERLARRVAMGLARTGTTAHHGSGDIVLAFSTATNIPHMPDAVTMPLVAINNTHLDPIFDATIECAEEAVGNALCMATTVEGRDGHTSYALPYAELRTVMSKYGHPMSATSGAAR
jgi:D-aminopeptidase